MADDQPRDEGNQKDDFKDKWMDVDEKCMDCGAEVKKLPFDPKGKPVRCTDCYRKHRDS
jgi:CxxC-x17-CxxC domain-containing protein